VLENLVILLTMAGLLAGFSLFPSFVCSAGSGGRPGGGKPASSATDAWSGGRS
jgi:hypothetical protein